MVGCSWLSCWLNRRTHHWLSVVVYSVVEKTFLMVESYAASTVVRWAVSSDVIEVETMVASVVG